MNIPWKFHALIRPLNVLPLSHPAITDWQQVFHNKQQIDEAPCSGNNLLPVDLSAPVVSTHNSCVCVAERLRVDMSLLLPVLRNTL